MASKQEELFRRRSVCQRRQFCRHRSGSGDDGRGNDGNDWLEGGYDGALDYLVGGNGIDTFWSKYTRKFGFFEITFESDWVGDFSLSDIQKKRSV